MDYPYLDTVIYDDFAQMLSGLLQSSPDVSALRFFKGDEIVDISYREMIAQIASVHAFINREGLCGRHIGIISENRYEYIVIYLAAVLNAVIVPLDKEADKETLCVLLDEFDVDAVFVTDKTAGKLPREIKAASAVNEREYSEIQPETAGDEKSRITSGKGRKIRVYNIDSDFPGIRDDKYPISDFLKEVKDTNKDRFAVLASTSGTDGKMKGVMLSQYNVITNIRGTLENNVLKNPTLAFLPMNHTYGFNPCMLATLYNGTTLCLNYDFKHLMRDIKAFDPFFFGAVPMVIEGMYEGILREVRKQKKERLFYGLLRTSNFLRRFGIDLRHVFFGEFITPGLRLVVNGGAPIRKEYVELFDELGIMILNGYGLTECSPTIAVSREFNNVAGSSGTIMKHIDVRIAEDGEILVKGPCVMLGYYKDEEATKECIHDGWLKTGDIGYTDGRVIFVTGRKKNLIITGNGKNVPPEYLEDKICALDCVAECLVVEKKIRSLSILCAKVYFKDSETEPEKQFKKALDELNKSLPDYMRIDDYEVMSEPFEKTGSGKIKRSRYQ